MLLFLFIVYLIYAKDSCGAPIVEPATNLTASRTDIAPGWVPGPSGRGTWELLYSCIFTLLLCVYTAVHLHVPPRDETSFRFWLRKTKWVAIAVIAPEIVVYVAFEQWFMARKFLGRLRDIEAEMKDEKFQDWKLKVVDSSRFDMVYAHYVVMGGMAADVRDLHNTLERVTFTPEGILFLAQHGHFCEVYRTDIEDKSKADILAKSLVCMQVLWLAGQALERKIAGLPTTLLEIHTIVHVFCALVMYCLWFQKPLNVQDPTIINLREDRHLLAFLLQLSSISSKSSENGEKLAALLHPPSSVAEFAGFKCKIAPSMGWKYEDEPEFWWYKSPRPLHRELVGAEDLTNGFEPLDVDEPFIVHAHYSYTVSGGGSTGFTKHYPIGGIRNTYKPSSTDPIRLQMFSGQVLPCGLGPAFPHFWKTRRSVHSDLSLAFGEFVDVVSLSAKDIKRLELVAEALKRPQPATISEEISTFAILTLADFYNWDDPALSYRARNLTGKVFLYFDGDSIYLRGAMVLIPAAYGSVHLAAKTIQFPSAIEAKIWNVSCYYLVAAAGILTLAFFVLYLEVLVHRRWRKASVAFRTKANDIAMSHKRFVDGAYSSIICILFLLFLVYTAARLYIVVESLISLRRVPIGVYQTPVLNIVRNIPHL